MTALLTTILAAALSPLGSSCLPWPASPSAGYEQGVSAMFAGATADGTAIIAGGANFPDVAAADGGQKAFYGDIHLLHDSIWRYAGQLPQPTAYGMSVALDNGLLCIGGSGPDGATAAVLMIAADGAISHPLPNLPQPIEQGAASRIGTTIYVAGGIVAGRASAQVWAIDLDSPDDGWRPCPPLPMPTVQPVMCAASQRLYLWCGFDPTSKSAQGMGFCYDPRQEAWREIGGLPDNGTLTGASAATLPTGSIVCTGGVDREVFEAALRLAPEQMHDYLSWPVERYRFRQAVYLFDPDSERWHRMGASAATARAGAGLIATPTSLIVVGGELKPGIRYPGVALLTMPR